jgi:uroporphyrinogen-III synthase
MQRESRQRRKSMREIAEAILLNDDLRKSRLGEFCKIADRESSPPRQSSLS